MYFYLLPARHTVLLSNVKVYSLTSVIYCNLAETYIYKNKSIKVLLTLCHRVSGFFFHHKLVHILNQQHDFIFIFSLNHETRQNVQVYFLFYYFLH